MNQSDVENLEQRLANCQTMLAEIEEKVGPLDLDDLESKLVSIVSSLRLIEESEVDIDELDRQSSCVAANLKTIDEPNRGEPGGHRGVTHKRILERHEGGSSESQRKGLTNEKRNIDGCRLQDS